MAISDRLLHLDLDIQKTLKSEEKYELRKTGVASEMMLIIAEENNIFLNPTLIGLIELGYEHLERANQISKLIEERSKNIEANS